MADTLIPLATTDEKDISMVGGRAADLGADYTPDPVTVPTPEPPRSLVNMPDRELQGDEDLSGFEPESGDTDGFEKDEAADLRDTYNSVKDSDPARNSEVKQLTEKTGEDPAYVEENFDEIRKQLKELPESKFDSIKRNSPKTAKWLEDPSNMALVHDDLDALTEVENVAISRMLGQDYSGGSGTPRKRYPDLEIGVINAAITTLQAPTGAVAAQLLPTNPLLKKGGHPVEEVPKVLYENPIIKALEEEKKYLYTLTPNSMLDVGTLLTEGRLSDGVSAAFSQIIQATPTSMAMVAAAAMGAPGLALMAFGVTGQKYKENKEAGQDEQWNELNAVGIGLVEYAFEKYTFGTFNIMKSTINAVARKYGEQTGKQVAKDLAKTLIGHVKKEGASEGATELGQKLWNYATDADSLALVGDIKTLAKRAAKDILEVGSATIVGGGMGFGFSAPTSFAIGIQRAQQVQQVKKDLQTYKDMGEAVSRLKLTELDRPALANLLEQVTDKSDIKEAFVSPEKIDLLFQKETKGAPASEENPHAIKATNAVEFAAEMGILKEYEEAKATGHKIKIPYAKFLEKLVKTNYYSALENDITFDVKKASANELAEDQKKSDALEKQAAEAETPEQKEAARVEAGIVEFKKNKIAEIVAAGTSHSVARAGVDNLISRARTRAATDPQKRTALDFVGMSAKVIAADDVPGGSLEQAAPNIRRVDEKQYSYDEVLDSAKRTGNDAEHAELGRDYGNYEKSKLGHPKIDMPPTAPRPTFSLIEVPVGLLFRPHVSNTVETPSDKMVAETKEDEAYAQKYSKLPAETAEPILVELKNGAIKVKDGRHRARAAFLRGDSHVKAFIESSQLENVLTGKLYQKDSLPAVVQQPTVSPLGFVSQVEIEVLKMDFKSMPAKDLLGRIENIQGIKKDEIEGMGLPEWLTARDIESRLPAAATVYEISAKQGEEGKHLDGKRFLFLFTKEEAEKYISDKLPESGMDRYEVKETPDDTNRTGKVSKEEVLAFVRERGVKVEQTVLSQSFDDSENGDSSLPHISELEWSKPRWKTEIEIDHYGSLVSDNVYENYAYGDEHNDTDVHKALDEWLVELKDEESDKYDEVARLTAVIKDEKLGYDKRREAMRAISKGMDFYSKTSHGRAVIEAAENRETESIEAGESTYSEETASLDNLDVEMNHRPESGEGWQATLPNGKNFDTDTGEFEEAKIRVAQKLLEEGYIRGNRTDLIKPGQIVFLDPKGKMPAEPTMKRRAEAHYKANSERLKAAVAADRVYGNSEEEKINDREYEARRDARKEVEAKYSDASNKKNVVTIEIKHPFLTGSVIGNSVKGWRLDVKLDRGGHSEPRIVEDLGKIPAAEVQAKAIEALKTAGVFGNTQEELAAKEGYDPNAPTGRATHSDKRWRMPGGTNYRELLLSVPSRTGDDYTDGHYGNEKDNVIAHIRVTDRVDSKGRKVLTPEENQSDWARDIWKFGAKGESAPLTELPEGYSVKEVDDQEWAFVSPDGEHLASGSSANAAKEVGLEYLTRQRDRRRVPSGPFVRSDAWIALTMKRVLQLAVQQGYDAIAWFPAEVHTERWGTSNVTWVKKTSAHKIFEIHGPMGGVIKGISTFDTIGDAETALGRYQEGRSAAEKAGYQIKEVPESYWLVGSTEQRGGNVEGQNIEELARQRGLLLERQGERVTSKEELRAVMKQTLGRSDDVSDAMVESVWKQMQEGDSGVREPRREFYENLYDKKIPKAVEGILKKLDKNAKIETLKVDTLGTESAINAATPVLGVVITPELKAAVQKGLPLFQQEETITRGFYSRQSRIIGLLKSANFLTLMHEFSHSWFQEMGEDIAAVKAMDPATLNDAQRKLLEDGENLLRLLGATSWETVTDEQQEKFARTAEDYFVRGIAPSKELQPAFTRFKKWALALMRTFREARLEMTPEVTGIFDRLLATEDQMAAAREQMNETNEAGTFGASGEKAGAILQAWSAARDSADDEFHDEVIADMKRQASATYREQKRKVEDEVIAEVNAEPVYKAIAYLTKGTYPDGKPLEAGIQKLKLDKKILNKMFKPAQLERLPHGISHNKNGVHPDTVATMLGFRNGTEMVLQMVAAEKKADLINRLTDERMKQRFPGLLDTPEVSEKAMEALHNDKKARLLRLQLEALAEHALPKLMEAGKMLIRRVPSDEQVRTQARNTINGKKMADIRPIIYQRAEVRASRMAAEAYAKGDIPTAFEHKRNEIYNHQLYLEAKKVQKFQEKAEKLFDKVSKADDKIAKSYNMDMVNAARAVLATYGIGDEDATPESFLKVMAANDPDTYEVISALVEYATQNAKNLDDMTYEQYEGLYQSVNSLWELARESRKFTSAEEALELEVVREAIVLSLSEYTKKNAGRMNRTPTDKDKRNVYMLGLAAAVRRVEHWADSISGGAISKYMVMPVLDSITQYRLKKAEVDKRLLEILKPFKGEMTAGAPIVANELNEGFQFENVGRLMGAILHTGNDSNIFKMLRGESSQANPDGWGALDAEGNLDRSKWQAFINRMYSEKVIEKRHMDAVQQIWNLFEEIKPFAQKAHKQMYGHYFSEITANELVTPFGVYRGGYMPAIGDPLRSLDAAKRGDNDDHFENAGSQMPQLNRGFTKQRLQNYATPLIMDLRAVPHHMDKSLRFSFIGPAYKQALALVNDNQVRAALDAYDPAIVKDMILPWLERSASQLQVTPAKSAAGRAFDKFLSAARSRTGMQLMPGNIPNALEQMTGIIVANSKVQAKFLRGAMARKMRSPFEHAAWVSSKSDWMKVKSDDSTFETQNQLRAILNATSKTMEWADTVKKHAYIAQAVTQGFVDGVVWDGAYNQAIAENRTEKQAVAAADKAVRLTQGTFNPEDISRFESGSALARMFSQFATYFNMVLNLSWTGFSQINTDFGIASAQGAGKALMLFTMVFWIPSVLGLALKRGFAGDLGEDDDGDGENLDDILWMFFEAPRDLMLATIPLVGPAAKVAIVNIWNDKLYDDRMPTAPALSMFESVKALKTVPQAIMSEESDPKKNAAAVRDFSTLVGLITGLPLRPVGKAVNYGIKKAGESE